MDKPRSGRTTGIALSLLGAALKAGGDWCEANDHHSGQAGMKALDLAVRMAADKQGLQVEIKLKPGEHAVMVRTAWTF